MAMPHWYSGRDQHVAARLEEQDYAPVRAEVRSIDISDSDHRRW